MGAPTPLRPGGPALRIVPFILVSLLTVPVVAADSEQGATVGLNLGTESRGLWDVFWLQHGGGGAGISLSWAASLFPGADYDLHLYRGDALDDGQLLPSELIAKSQTRTFATHTEALGLGLNAGLYLVAVVPWQTQGETYTLQAAGNLEYATTAVGVCRYCY